MPTPHQFLMDIPDYWDELDLTGEKLASSRAQMLATTNDPGEKARINEIFRQGRELSQSARRHGALLAVNTTAMYDDGLFMAYGMVFAVSTPPGSELTLPVLSAQLGISTADSTVPKDRVISSVAIPAVGTVARVTGTETTRLTADVDVQLVTMHTMMPVPGTTDNFLVVTMASPNLPLKDEVYDLFDAITGTFRFLAADGTQLAPAS